MADVQTDVPQGVDHFPDQGVGGVGDPLFKEEKHVHIRVETLLLPAVAAQGDDRIGVPIDLEGRSHRTLLELLAEIVVQNPGVAPEIAGRPIGGEVGCHAVFLFQQTLGDMLIWGVHV